MRKDHLFQELQIRSVTANSRADAREFLQFAGRHRLEVMTVPYPLDQADRALTDLAVGRPGDWGGGCCGSVGCSHCLRGPSR